MNIHDVLDTEELFVRLDNDMELLQELIEIFLEDYPHQMEAIAKAIQTKDGHELRHAAHTLKGAVGNFCAKTAFDLSYQLEKKGEQQDFSNVEAVYSSLESELKKVVSALHALAAETVTN